MATSLLLACGGLGFFLLGMTVLARGLAALAGRVSRAALLRFTRSPVSGAVTGALATIAVQSSSVTTVTAVGFVSAVLITFPQALGLILGANVGTTATGWLVALLGLELDIAPFVLPLVLVGALLDTLGHGRWAQLGLALAGFGLVFYGLSVMGDSLSGLELVPERFPPDTLLGRAALVGIGVLVTLLTHSSSAGVAASLAALHAGAIDFPQAGALVIGMDVGTTSSALLASLGGGAASRRTAAAHVLFNVLTGVAAFLLLPLFDDGLWLLGSDWIRTAPELALVAFHTSFNVLGLLLMLPFVGRFTRWIERLVPERGASWSRHLDPALLRETSLALGAVLATLREMVPEVLREVAKWLVRPVSSPERERAAFRPALAGVREYLDRTHVPDDLPLEQERHQRCMHVLDHLERLLRRCERASSREALAPDGPPADETLAARGSELAGLLERVALEPSRATARELGDLRRRLGTLEPTYRRDVLARTARGELETEEALARLDRMRLLRRVAGHAWRISLHLERATGDRRGS